MIDDVERQKAYLEAADSLLERIYEYCVDADTFVHYRPQAWAQFFGPLIPPGQLPDDHPDWDAFDDWFIFDYQISSGLTPFEQFFVIEKLSLPDIEREIGERWREDSFGLFGVESVEEGAGTHLKNLADGQTFVAPTIRLTRRQGKWDYLIGRLVPVGTGHSFTTSPRYLMPALAEMLPDDFNGKQPPSGDRRGRSVEFWRSVRQLAAEQPTVPVTDEGDPLRPSQADYRIDDFAAVAEILRKLRFLDKATDGAEGEQMYSWIGRSPAEPKGPRIVMGVVRLFPDRLVLECLSPQRIARGKMLLEAALGAHARLIADSVAPAETPALSAEDASKTRTAGLVLGELLQTISKNERLEALSLTDIGSEAAILIEHFEAEPFALLAGLHRNGPISVNRAWLKDGFAGIEISIDPPGETSYSASARLRETPEGWRVQTLRPGKLDQRGSEGVGDDPHLIALWTGSWQWAPVGPAGNHPILGITLARLHRTGRTILEQVLAVRIWNNYVAKESPDLTLDPELWAVALGEISDWQSGRTPDAPESDLARRIIAALDIVPRDSRYFLDQPVMG